MTDPRPSISQSKARSLLLSLVALLALMPFATRGTSGRLILGFLSVGVVAFGSLALHRTPRERKRVSVLGALSIIGIAAFIGARNSGLPEDAVLLFPIFFLIFLVDVTAALLRFVAGDQSTARARLYAALSVYILIGLGFAMLYFLLYLLSPDSFAFNAATEAVLEQSASFIYFSFVTLTTLGYGDIQPVSPFAQSIAVLEAITGVLYVAVMVASLVASLERGDGDVSP